MSVFSAISRPSRVALNGVLGAGLSTTVFPVASACAELVDGDLEREVPRHDGADHADRLVPDLAAGHPAGQRDERVPEIGLPRKGVDESRRVLESVGERGVQLRSVCHRPRGADLAG